MTVVYKNRDQLERGKIFLTLQNGWVSMDSIYYDPYYIIKGTRVELGGLCKSGTTTAGTVVFNLPPEARPSKASILATTSNKTLCEVRVNTNGDVTLNSAANSSYLFFDGLSYPLT